MAARTASCRHALLTALHAKLLACALLPRKPFLRACASSSSMAFVAVVLAALLCGAAAAFPRAVAFFLPLVASTSTCCAAVYLFAASDSERGAAEVVLIRGEGKPEAGLLAVYDDANASAYGRGGVQVGCFLRSSAKRGVDEDGEEVVFAGRLLTSAATGGGLQHGELEEELGALQVDRLSETVWNSYFGRWSTWNYVED